MLPEPQVPLPPLPPPPHLRQQQRLQAVLQPWLQQPPPLPQLLPPPQAELWGAGEGEGEPLPAQHLRPSPHRHLGPQPPSGAARPRPRPAPASAHRVCRQSPAGSAPSGGAGRCTAPQCPPLTGGTRRSGSAGVHGAGAHGGQGEHGHPAGWVAQYEARGHKTRQLYCNFSCSFNSPTFTAPASPSGFSYTSHPPPSPLPIPLKAGTPSHFGPLTHSSSFSRVPPTRGSTCASCVLGCASRVSFFRATPACTPACSAWGSPRTSSAPHTTADSSCRPLAAAAVAPAAGAVDTAAGAAAAAALVTPAAAVEVPAPPAAAPAAAGAESPAATAAEAEAAGGPLPGAAQAASQGPTSRTSTAASPSPGALLAGKTSSSSLVSELSLRRPAACGPCSSSWHCLPMTNSVKVRSEGARAA